MLACRDRCGCARRRESGWRCHRVDVRSKGVLYSGVAVACEGDLGAVRRPRRAHVVARIVGEVSVSATVAVYRPDLPWFATAAHLALLHEHHLRAVRGPIRRSVIALEAVPGQDRLVLAVWVHRNDLRPLVPNPGERYLGAIRRPGGVALACVCVGEVDRVVCSGIGVHHENVWLLGEDLARDLPHEDDLGARWRPRGLVFVEVVGVRGIRRFGEVGLVRAVGVHYPDVSKVSYFVLVAGEGYPGAI